MMKDIVIIGAGGFGREVAWLIEDINKIEPQWNILGFVDDNEDIIGAEFNGYKVLGNVDWLLNQKLHVVNAIGDPIAKQDVMKRLTFTANTYPVLIHPSVVYSSTINFGEGAIICPGNVITVNIEIGKHAIVNFSCTIGHDAKIGNFSTILPGVNVSGYVCKTRSTRAISLLFSEPVPRDDQSNQRARKSHPLITKRWLPASTN